MARYYSDDERQARAAQRAEAKKRLINALLIQQQALEKAQETHINEILTSELDLSTHHKDMWYFATLRMPIDEYVLADIASWGDFSIDEVKRLVFVKIFRAYRFG